jgi:hypothetical protein
MKKKRLLFAISGLILTGAGLSLLGEAIIYRFSEKPFWDWFGMGTLALVVFNCGLSLAIYSLRFLKN